MNEYEILNTIESPGDVQRLPSAALPKLCGEIRAFLLQSVSVSGGHLASNLGVVELTVALHRVFDSKHDRLIFDVGHQSYVHKLLTGRRDQFSTLRSMGGLSGFPRPAESPHDAFVAGHASTSVSVGIGMARARTLQKEDYSVVCILGDGALTGGLAYEALNDAGESGEPLIVVFNDNDMSIDKNVGAVAAKLSRLRNKGKYLRLKEITKAAFSKIPGGRGMIRGLREAKAFVRKIFLPTTIFEQMGFYYLGPADGHDIETVERLLTYANSLKAPVVLHIKTVKGKGYGYSEKAPERFHGVSPFDLESGMRVIKPNRTFSSVFGEELAVLAEKDSRIVAITAAMRAGTGLSRFANEFPGRFLDVGIAEAHAVTTASAMAKQGMRPVCALYSTFLQRAFDQILHDTALLQLPIVLAVDRAGIVGEDGETHNGVFDLAFLATVPGMQVYAPSGFAELRSFLRRALGGGVGPCAIRYPRGGQGDYEDDRSDEAVSVLRQGHDITIVSYGILINEAEKAAELLKKHGIIAELVKLNRIVPIEIVKVSNSVQKTGRLVVLEDVIQAGGCGERILAALLKEGTVPSYVKLFNVGDGFLPAGKIAEIDRVCGVDGRSVFEAIMEEAGFEGENAARSGAFYTRPV